MSKPTESSALLATLSDSSALPALVERLEPGELKRLVDAVGLEDAGALVAYASPTQLAHLVDESVWASTNPGDPETLSVPELLRWLDLWLDMGDGFVAEKLNELGESFCALVFAKLVTVLATDLAPGEVDEFSLSIGEYLVRAKFDDEWDTVQSALVTLWDDYPDFLEAVFARLSFRHSILGIRGEDRAQQILEADASFEREVRKEAEGFVTATTAGAFLSGIASTELDALLDEQRYDPETAEYFARQTRKIDMPAAEHDSVAKAGSLESTPEMEAELDELQSELEHYEIVQRENVALLTGPKPADGIDELPIRRALATLAADSKRPPGCIEARTAELAYLSNLLMSEVTLGGDKMSEFEAANLVMATCNLGGGYVLWADAREIEPSGDQNPFVDMLLEEPGLVRLFRIGWNLTRHLPLQAANRLVQALTSSDTHKRFADKPWLADEVEALLRQPSLNDVVRSGDFDQARVTIKVLTIALQPEVVEALCQIIDDVPRLTRFVDGRSVTGEDSGFITSMKDMLRLDRFLLQLHTQVRI